LSSHHSPMYRSPLAQVYVPLPMNAPVSKRTCWMRCTDRQ
jgi:hypothetical protein